jgi:hypothetical protein
MEGFDAARYDEQLGLAEQGLVSSVIVAFGTRSPTDPAQFKKKYRRAQEQFLVQFP